MLHPDTEDRLIRALLRVEAWPENDPADRAALPLGGGEQVQMIRADGSGFGSGTGSGYYSAYIQDYDSETNTWSDLDPCMAIDPNGGQVREGWHLARMWGDFDAGSGPLPVFSVGGADEAHTATVTWSTDQTQYAIPPDVVFLDVVLGAEEVTLQSLSTGVDGQRFYIRNATPRAALDLGGAGTGSGPVTDHESILRLSALGRTAPGFSGFDLPRGQHVELRYGESFGLIYNAVHGRAKHQWQAIQAGEFRSEQYHITPASLSADFSVPDGVNTVIFHLHGVAAGPANNFSLGQITGGQVGQLLWIFVDAPFGEPIAPTLSLSQLGSTLQIPPAVNGLMKPGDAAAFVAVARYSNDYKDASLTVANSDIVWWLYTITTCCTDSSGTGSGTGTGSGSGGGALLGLVDLGGDTLSGPQSFTTAAITVQAGASLFVGLSAVRATAALLDVPDVAASFAGHSLTSLGAAGDSANNLSLSYLVSFGLYWINNTGLAVTGTLSATLSNLTTPAQPWAHDLAFGMIEATATSQVTGLVTNNGGGDPFTVGPLNPSAVPIALIATFGAYNVAGIGGIWGAAFTELDSKDDFSVAQDMGGRVLGSLTPSTASKSGTSYANSWTGLLVGFY